MKNICMAQTANGCSNAATTTREDKPVCKTHAKSKTIVWKSHQLTIDGALDQAAMNPGSTTEGIAKAKKALNKEETMYTAYVIAAPIITKDEEDNPIKAVFPVIQESTKMRSIEDHIEAVKKNFAGWTSVHYIFFKDEQGNKLYYPRRRARDGEMVFQAMNMKEGLAINIRKFNACNRCLGTGIYAGPSRVHQTDKWGNSTRVCFGCKGDGEAK